MNGRLPTRCASTDVPACKPQTSRIRLRRTANEVEDALSQVASSRLLAMWSMSNLRESWRIVATQDTPRAFRLAVTTLMRGLRWGCS